MELNTIILMLLLLVSWRILFHKHTITLSSPLFKNTEKKEIGAWAYYEMKIPTFPYLGLLIHDGRGGVYRVLEVQYDKASKEIFCRTYLEQPFCDDEEQYEHIKKNVLNSGWKVREVKPYILHWWKDEYELIDMGDDYKQSH